MEHISTNIHSHFNHLFCPSYLEAGVESRRHVCHPLAVGIEGTAKGWGFGDGRLVHADTLTGRGLLGEISVRVINLPLRQVRLEETPPSHYLLLQISQLMLAVPNPPHPGVRILRVAIPEVLQESFDVQS